MAGVYQDALNKISGGLGELLFFGRTLQGSGGTGAGLDGLGHRIEIAGTDFTLMLDCSEAAVSSGELALLQLYERTHLAAGITMCQIEHAVVQGMEAGQGNELELVAHGAEFFLEFGDGGIVEIFLPVEARRAVISQQLAREFGVNRFGELSREFQIGFAGFTPDKIGVGRIGQTAGDSLVDARAGFVESFNGALAGAERFIVVIDV